jgi:hypothetical protein
MLEEILALGTGAVMIVGAVVLFWYVAKSPRSKD